MANPQRFWRAAREWGERLRQHADDRGATLLELVVTFGAEVVLVGTAIGFFGTMSATSQSSRALTTNEEVAHGALRTLESDVASANPLVLVPSSFTDDPSGSSNVGPNGTTPTDIIAMQESSDPYSSCSAGPGSTTTTSTTTTTLLPSPYSATTTAANVIWAYDPAKGVLTRYSWCSSSASWQADTSVPGLRDASATMFQLVQANGASLTQSSLPSSTVVPNQTSPSCGTSLRISLLFAGKTAPFSFTVGTSVQMPNQSQALQQGCG